MCIRDSSKPQELEQREHRFPVKGVRKVIAENMVASKFSAPHVSVFVDVDATRTMEFVKRLKTSSQFEGVKAVSYTHLDVYKRQGVLRAHGWPEGRGTLERARRLLDDSAGHQVRRPRDLHGAEGEVLAAVSYTHLDVYKRQLTMSPKRPSVKM